MYETAVQHDLPIGIHFTGVGVGPITAVGRPSHYIEDHAGHDTGISDPGNESRL